MADLHALREKIKWRARRGLLEIDLFFTRFADSQLGSLNSQQLVDLLDLLSCDDHELWAMISGKQECTVEKWQGMVALLRSSSPNVPIEEPISLIEGK